MVSQVEAVYRRKRVKMGVVVEKTSTRGGGVGVEGAGSGDGGDDAEDDEDWTV